FMVLLAAFQALLSRVSGQEDLAVGSPVANRDRLETEPLIGFFANTLALRGELAGDPDFRELLGRARTATLGAWSHQDVPFEKLVEELSPQRDPSRTPLFQVALALQNAPAAPLELPGLRTEPLDLDAGVSRFDLTLLLREEEDGLAGAAEYAADLFDAVTVERLLRCYRTLLDAAVADPGQRLSELPLLTDEETRQLVAESVGQVADWPGDVLLHEFFEAQARRTPDAVALIGGTERLTFRALDERADRMARRLRSLGVGAETRVGVFLQRTPRLLISMLGILKAGGAYVPLDPAYPRERVEAILTDSAAPVVITEGTLLEALPQVEASLVRADEDGPADLPLLEPSPVRMGRLAYVIYTSGSTGRPKGVAIEHRTVSALMSWCRDFFRPEELRGVLASTSICFDMSVFELFAPLAWGGTVILADNALALPDLPARDEVTLIDTVPSAMAELLRQGAVPKSVRTVNLGGEPLRGALAAQVHALGTVGRLLNLYGPSEDTTFSTVADVGPEGEPTIGRILTNSWGYILDRRLRPVPAGVAGELYLGGAGISRGYLGRPDMTAERYVPDPFPRDPGGRLYKTGDLVRLRNDGELEFLGRLDHQVKIRGFRVELGEIEAALLAYPPVRDAAVLTLGEGGDRRLVAYVAGETGETGETDAGALRAYLKEKLPDYMVPAVFVSLAALPLTPNGKVDRRALAGMAPEPQGGTADAYVAPRNPIEEILAPLWAEVLGVDRVGVNDDFFDLGGHSLLGVQLVSRVREMFGVKLPVRAVFTSATVAGMAELVETEMIAALAGDELLEQLFEEESEMRGETLG
ncbi:MAG TPA: amino acid adenylation domain-containing protein, partial [Thermoanaerobaculia bacterium]|nr:amino acid adenylation domain-containing protein [Thermoanaerobaculia bacterium]